MSLDHSNVRSFCGGVVVEGVVVVVMQVVVTAENARSSPLHTKTDETCFTHGVSVCICMKSHKQQEVSIRAAICYTGHKASCISGAIAPFFPFSSCRQRVCVQERD